MEFARDRLGTSESDNSYSEKGNCSMLQVVLIAVGGSLGCVARYGMATFVYEAVPGIFPWGTLFVNTTGSFLIGVLSEIFETALIPSEWRSLITIGFIGGYTTFSTYALETLNLIREGEIQAATYNVLASTVLGIAFVALGIYSSRVVIKLLT